MEVVSCMKCYTVVPEGQYHACWEPWKNLGLPPGSNEERQAKECLEGLGIGRKNDNGKPRYSLIPPKALQEVVKVLEHGARKYSPENWRRVPDGPQRYWDASQRHSWANRAGEKIDAESGLRSLAHSIVSQLFCLELELESDG